MLLWWGLHCRVSHLHLSIKETWMQVSKREDNCLRWFLGFKLWVERTSGLVKDHVYRMVKVKYSNIWPNQTIVSDQSELTILLCQPMILYVCSEDDVNWVQRPSTFHILYTWSLFQPESSEQPGSVRVKIKIFRNYSNSFMSCTSSAENSAGFESGNCVFSH